MMEPRRVAGRLLTVLCLMVAVLAAPRAASAEEIRLEGTYVLSASGDVAMSLKLTPPMVIYQQLRDSVWNLYLVLRQFASSRADTEVVDKKAEWDDSNRSMTFSVKLLGASRNLGNRWELDIPKGTEFINLDEPTSALDAKAEAAVFRNFRELAAGRTAILISHRFSTIRMADRIFVLQDGRITETGTHDELMDGGGTYAHLCETQAHAYR